MLISEPRLVGVCQLPLSSLNETHISISPIPPSLSDEKIKIFPSLEIVGCDSQLAVLTTDTCIGSLHIPVLRSLSAQNKSRLKRPVLGSAAKYTSSFSVSGLNQKAGTPAFRNSVLLFNGKLSSSINSAP